MSKYTTEVRYICEQKSGLEESKGFTSVDNIISKSWDKIFTSKVNFFDEDYRQVICKKILKHYYMREIGCETVGLWMLWMNTRLEEIMPFYNQLYESELIKFNPLYDVDITRKHNRTGTENKTGTRGVSGNRDTSVNKTGTSNTVDTADSVSRDLYADTPQGALTALENETYLTNARKVSGNVTDTVNVDTTDTEKSGVDYKEDEKTSGKLDSTEEYVETLVGKQGAGNYSDMLVKFRDTFLNIDMQVIEEFSDLFFELW